MDVYEQAMRYVLPAPEHRYVVTVWDDSGGSGRSILAQVEVSASDEGDAARLGRRLLLPEHRGLPIEAERIT